MAFMPSAKASLKVLAAVEVVTVTFWPAALSSTISLRVSMNLLSSSSWIILTWFSFSQSVMGMRMVISSNLDLVMRSASILPKGMRKRLPLK